MKKHFNLKSTLYFLQVATVTLIAIGVLPRYYAFLIAGVVLIYMLFADWIDALCFSVASIPFYIALPITANMDKFMIWRLVFIELFILLIIKNRKLILENIKNIKEKFFIVSFRKDFFRCHAIELGAVVLLLMALISLVGATNKADGVKRVIYYANIALFYFILAYGIQSIDDAKKVLKSLAVAGGVFVSVGFIQLIILYFVSYQSFWSFWSDRIIKSFYGQQLSNFLSFNNTWFVFSSADSASLRMFSLLPTSHAFAMIMILLIPIPFVLYYLREENRKNKILLWTSLAFLMLGVILSGSRGAWVSITIILLLTSAIWFYKRASKKMYLRKMFYLVLLFSMLFPLSPILLKSSGLRDSSFGRIWSVKDTDEVSNKTRLEIWKSSFDSIKENPVLGTGLSNFSAEIEKFGEKYKTTSHNIFLYIATEVGIIGVLIMLWMCFTLIKDLLNEFYLSDSKFLNMLFLGTVMGIMWVLCYSLIIDELLNADKTTIIFITIIGICYAIRRIQKRKRDAIGFGGSDVV